MDPTDYLKQLWEKLQQTYRNAQAGAYSVGSNNPFNNQYFQQLTQGQLTSKGLTPGGAAGGQYSNDLSGVVQGLMDRVQQTAHPATQAVRDLYHKLFSQ